MLAGSASNWLTLLLGGPGFACYWQNFWCYFRGAELHFYRVARVEKISGAVSEHQSTSVLYFKAAKHHFYWLGLWCNGLVLVTDVGLILSSPLAPDHSSQRHKGVVGKQYFNHPLHKYLLTLWYIDICRNIFLPSAEIFLADEKASSYLPSLFSMLGWQTIQNGGGITADWGGNHDNTIA